MIFILLLALYVFLLAKGFNFKILGKIPYRLPLTFKEKEMVKNYYGTKNLTAVFTEYAFKVMNNILLASPLLLLSLLFYRSWLAVLFPIVIWGYKYEYLKIKKLVYKRKVEFYKAYPGFLNSLKLYLESGLSLENSLELYFDKTSSCYYLSLLENYLSQIKIGKNRKEILMDLISASRERVIINLLNYFIHFLDLGSRDLGYLDYLLAEAWKLKKETIKKIAEEASAKMVFPMMLIFIGVVILVIVPSLSSLGGMNLF